MLQRSSEAENVLPRLPPEPDYSGASSSGSAQSWFCRDQGGLICADAKRFENIFMCAKMKCLFQKKKFPFWGTVMPV